MFDVTIETIVSTVTSNLVGQNLPVNCWLSIGNRQNLFIQLGTVCMHILYIETSLKHPIGFNVRCHELMKPKCDKKNKEKIKYRTMDSPIVFFSFWTFTT